MPTPEGNRDRTFRYDRWRGISAGLLETAGGTFLLFVAVRHHEAGATAKALIAAGGGLGLLLSPLAVHAVASLRWRCSAAASAASLLGAAGFLLAALPHLAAYVAGSLLALLSGSLLIPFVTQIYQDNYHGRERGQLFSRAMMVKILSAAAFSQFAGWALASFYPSFRWLLFLFAAAQLFSAFCFSKIPSRQLPHRQSAHPLQALRLVGSDPVFRTALISWMLLGFGNLMIAPLRVDYLANPRYGLALEATGVALLTGVIPNVVRLAFSPLWGWLFDRLNFFLLRIAINLGIGIGVVTFFTGRDPLGLALGAAAFGAAIAGGDLAWSLWVTKLAPPDKVADYMSVHTFFTGTRALVAPFVGFYAAARLPMGTLGWICAALILAASLLLLPEVRIKPRRKGEPLSGEFSE